MHYPFTGNWNYPTRIKAGAGRIKELVESCKELGMSRPLLVTDPGIATMPMIETAIKSGLDQGLELGLFSEIQSNPTGENITQGVKAFKSGKHDGVIAFGGGSALDAGKAIALMAGQVRPLWDFEDVGANWQRVLTETMAPVLAVPTTAGTGSEVGRASVITDTEEKVKKIIFHPRMLPNQVILDPELTVALPKSLTAATGMDALSHCLEAYCATAYHPMAEAIAMEGIVLIKDNLLRAYEQGDDLPARMQMLVASAMGATAFQRGLGAMHALAHPLGALYNAHHGRLNAIVMPYVLHANRKAIETKINCLSQRLNLRGFDGFMSWILDLRSSMGIEHTLAEIGIEEVKLPQLAKMATLDAASGSNPVNFSEQEYLTLLQHCMQGRLENI